MSESSHKVYVKDALENTGNHIGSRTLECAKFLQKKAHADGLMRKVDATNRIAAAEASPLAEPAPPADGSDGCPLLWKYRVRNVRSVVVSATEEGFAIGRPGVHGDGYPFLHPQVSLARLHDCTIAYLAELKRQSRKHEEEIVQLESALGRSSDMDIAPSLILTEAIKCNTQRGPVISAVRGHFSFALPRTTHTKDSHGFLSGHRTPSIVLSL